MSTTTIPRFLLPRSSTIWRHKSIQSSALPQLRQYARQTPSKPIVLEKPSRFNPPSHGARLKKPGPRYPGPKLSAEEVARQSTKKYPHMMPAEGTFLHWFITNRSIHVWITMGVLGTLASFTFITNFKRTSKFADMLPDASDLFFHPIGFTKQCFEVLRLHTAAVGAETKERRQRSVDDVTKRDAYRKAHGLDTDGFGGWSAKKDEELMGPAIAGARGINIQEIGAADGESKTNAGPVANDADGGLEAHVQDEQRSKKPLRKWLGIW